MCVDPDDLDAPATEGVGVAPGAASDVEEAGSRPEVEGADEEVDLLLGALGAGVPQVRPTQMVGEVLEPVVALTFSHVHAARSARIASSVRSMTSSTISVRWSQV